MTTKPNTRSNSTLKMVNVAELNVDPEAQRKLSPTWVKARVPTFDAEQLGYVVLNRRSDGKYYIVDGQHRAALMRAIGWGDQKILAEVFEGLNQAEEAALFNARNDRKAVRKFDKFRISIVAGNPVSCAIDRIVREHGLLLSDQLRDGHITAVDALERVYNGAGIASPKAGPKALAHALSVVVGAWGNQPSSVNGKIILALGVVFLRYDGTVNENDLAKKLAPFPGGAPGLIGKGRSMQELRGRQLHHCIAAIIVDIYNKGRRVEKLEAWDS